MNFWKEIASQRSRGRALRHRNKLTVKVVGCPLQGVRDEVIEVKRR